MTQAVAQPLAASLASHAEQRTLASVLILLGVGVARGTAATLLLHSLLALAAISVALHVLGLWALSVRSISAGLSALAIHAVAVPLVLSAGCALAAATTIQRARVGHYFAVNAMERAALANPKLREVNDVPKIASSVKSVIDTMAEEARAQTGGGFAFLRRHIVSRVIKVVGWTTLKQLDLYPVGDGTYDYARIEDWVGARIDKAAASTIRRSAGRTLALVLLLQLILTTGVLVTARPGQSPPSPTQPVPTTSPP